MSIAICGEPLLPSVMSAASPTAAPDATAARKSKHSLRPLVVLLILVHLSSVLYTLPLNRVIELRLCQEHYKRHDPTLASYNGTIPEKLCKIDEIQRQLAWLQGVMETTMVVGGT